MYLRQKSFEYKVPSANMKSESSKPPQGQEIETQILSVQ